MSRSPRWPRRLVLGIVAGTLVVSAAPPAALAVPDTARAAQRDEGPVGDVASPNVRLVANLPTGPGGDLAFWGKRAVVALGTTDGSRDNDGFALVDIRRPESPRVISRFLCPGSASVNGGQDVSIWEDLVILTSQAETNAAACLDGTGTGSGSEMLEPGAMIIDISDPVRPRRIAHVPVGCVDGEHGGALRGAHTHTLVPDVANSQLILYTFNTVYPCSSIVRIPLAAPHEATRVRHIDIATVFVEGRRELDLVQPPGTCHDLQVYLPKRLGACAASETGWQMWDLSDLERPVLLSEVDNHLGGHHHSAAFSSDGKTLVIGEEQSALGTCPSGTGTTVGALWFYDISDPRNPVLLTYYQNPMPNVAAIGWCTAHYFNIVPMSNNRDVLVAGWYGAGTVVVDFTDPRKPTTLGYFLAAALDPKRASNAYASYWYNGYVYVSNFGGDALGLFTRGERSYETRNRGLDVLAIDDSAVSGAVKLPYLNPGTQTWATEGQNQAREDMRHARQAADKFLRRAVASVRGAITSMTVSFT